MATRKPLVVGADGLAQQLQSGDTLSGAADPWTRSKLASDFSNSTVTFNTVSDGTTTFSFTPPANSDFVIEAELLVTTAVATSLPRVGVSIGAGQSYGAVEMTYQSGAAAMVVTEGQFQTGAVTVQTPAGTAPVTTPFFAWVFIKGHAGASPGAITIQLAAETAATAAAVKAGSEFRTRTI